MTESPEDVERLRVRLRELEEQLAARDAAPVAEVRSRRDRQWWRSIIVVVLIVVAAALAPLTVLATWAHDQIGDTDQFEQTVAPLGSDPTVQAAIGDRITEEITTRIDVEEITKEALTALAGQDFVPSRAGEVLPSLAIPLSNAIENFVQARVDQVVTSEAFEEAWVSTTRAAHEQMVAVLTGNTSEAVDVSDGAVKINIAPFVESVKQTLIDDGFSFAERIPEVNASFTIFQAENIGVGQKAFGWLDTLVRVLPVLALLLLFIAVMVARDRRKALFMAGLAIAISMVLLGLALNIVRPIYLDAIPADVLPSDAAATIYDQVVSFIRISLRAVGIVFLAIALAAFWFAPDRGWSGAADRIRDRHGTTSQPDRHGHRAGRTVPGDLPHLHPGHRRGHWDADLPRDRPSHRRQRRGDHHCHRAGPRGAGVPGRSRRDGGRACRAHRRAALTPAQRSAGGTIGRSTVVEAPGDKTRTSTPGARLLACAANSRPGSWNTRFLTQLMPRGQNVP